MPVTIFHEHDIAHNAIHIRLRADHNQFIQDRVSLRTVGTSFNPHVASITQALRRAEQRINEHVSRILGDAMDEVLSISNDVLQSPLYGETASRGGGNEYRAPDELLRAQLELMAASVTPPVVTMPAPPMPPKRESPPAVQKGRVFSLD